MYQSAANLAANAHAEPRLHPIIIYPFTQSIINIINAVFYCTHSTIKMFLEVFVPVH